MVPIVAALQFLVALRSKPKPLDAAGLLDYALRLLSGRSLTLGELRMKLRARAANRADVEPAIARLKEYGYLDDRRFAETFARLRVENQGVGRYRVLRDLKSRRIAPQIAEKAVAEAYRDVDEDALIRDYLARRLRRRDPADLTPSRLASLYRLLLRAGFTSGGIRKALGRLSAPEEWVEGLESAMGEGAADS